MYWRRDEDYAIRDGDWKLTWNDDNGPQTIRLFNMVDDPYEANDQADKKPEIAQALKDKFDAWGGYPSHQPAQPQTDQP